MPYAYAEDGTRIYYRIMGDKEAPPLLMLHGLGTDQLGWLMQRRAFTDKYRCIFVDNRGSGRSDKPDGPYTMEELALDAIAVLDDAGIDRCHVMGASMGGAISQLLAVMAPERVDALVLSCTACDIGEWRHDLFEGWIETAAEEGMHAFMTNNLNWLIGPRSLRRLWPIANLIGLFAQRAPVHGLIGQLHALRTADPALRDELRNVTAPTLVIVGSQDILTPVADSELIASLIPDAQLAIIGGAAHGLMIENAATFNSTVLNFLDSVDDPVELEAKTAS